MRKMIIGLMAVGFVSTGAWIGCSQEADEAAPAAPESIHWLTIAQEWGTVKGRGEVRSPKFENRTTQERPTRGLGRRKSEGRNPKT